MKLVSKKSAKWNPQDFGKEKTKLQKQSPPDGVVNTGTESRRIVVETTVEDRTTMYELTAEDVGAGVVQADSLRRQNSKDELGNEKKEVIEKVYLVPRGNK